MNDTKMKITWLDSGREPTGKPNPAFPDGVDIDASRGEPIFCRTALPYPAPRCGAFEVRCPKCDASALVTTAGRLDDPRSLKLACKYERMT